MTFRPTTSKQKRRRSRSSDSRRSVYFVIFFGLATLISVALLSGVVLGNYYTDHWAPVSSVYGSAISKDDVRNRASVDLARYQRQVAIYQALRNQGKITGEEYQTIASSITSQEQASTLYQTALTQLQQDLVIARFAREHGINVTDADVNAQIQKDATVPEKRHVEIIAVEPVNTPPANFATPDQMAAAKSQAEAYLAEIKGGKSWDDVYTESTKSGKNGAQGTSGDMGLIVRADLDFDINLRNAVWALAKTGDLTPVFKGEDGVYRFATVTRIFKPYVDPDWQSSVANASSGDGYRGVARADALEAAVRKYVEKQYVESPTSMRYVQELAVSPGFGQPGDGPEFKFRLILCAPNHSATNASSVPASDPAWASAKDRCQQALDKIQADPSQWTTLAKDTTINDDANFASNGGDVPWIPGPVIYDAGGTEQASLNMPAVRTALLKADVKPGLIGPLLEPSMGYVLIDYQGTRQAPAQRIADLQLEMALGNLSFTSAVLQYSESTDAADQGIMGWVGAYSMPTELQQAIFSTPVDHVSPVVKTSSGYWLFKILAEKSRVGDKLEQEKALRSLWTSWLNEQTAAANAWTDSAAMTAITPTTATGQ